MTTRVRARIPVRALGLLALVGFVLVLWVASGAPASAASSHRSLVAGILSDEVTPTTAPPPTASDELGPGKAIVLGVVEGITEFLPISSTGHLLVTERLLGIGTTDATKDAADSYAVIIQAGAILAVLVLYHRRLLTVVNGAVGRDPDGRKLLISLVIAFLPAAVVGFLGEKTVKAHLFGPGPIVIAWIIGGIALLALSSRGWLDREKHGIGILDLTARDALVIGVAQCLALWPGTSRSLVTIVAAILIGVSLSAAVEFSFLLGFVTLGAATVLDLARHGHEITAAYGWANPLLGFVVAFLAAIVAIRWMVTYLQNHSLAIFGWYRLAIAAITIALLAADKI